MNVQAILAKIDEEARESAKAILSDAALRAETMKRASDEQILLMREDTLKKGALEAAAMEERMLRMAQLDESKELLFEKRKLIDETFEKALYALCKLPAGEKERFFLSLLVESASGDELISVGENNKDWYTEGFIEKANQALIAAGKPGNLQLSGDSYPLVTGFVLLGKGTQVHCTMEAALNASRLALEAGVATLLYA